MFLIAQLLDNLEEAGVQQDLHVILQRREGRKVKQRLHLTLRRIVRIL